jgi:2-C-methyl-D-erythritol 4-phosphate cytidylyltransferase
MSRAASRPDVAVVIPAGGAGRRLGGSTPKQYLKIGTLPIIAVAVRAFERVRQVSQIIVVVPQGYAAYTHRLLQRAGCVRVTAVIEGGKERQDSVRAGLAMITGDPEIVLIHDAVRPFISRRVIEEVIRESVKHGAAVVGVRVKDTIKREGREGFYQDTLPRHLLWAVQTPQGFRRHLIIEAHARAAKAGFVGTDDAMLVERMRRPVRIVEGDYGNVKITTREDLLSARSRVSRRPG